MNNDNLRRVHKTLLDNGYTPPTYEEFENDMQDDNNLRGVYETLKKEGYTPPEYEQFKSDMGFAKVDANPNVNANGGVNADADAKSNGDADPNLNAKPNAKPWEAKVAGVPSLYDIADKQREETPKMPNYRHEVSVDEEGGKISKPVVKMSAIGNTPQVAPVFKDYAGNEYDATDPKVLEEAKRQVSPIVNTPKAQEEPSLLESIGKSIGAGAVRAGTQMIDVLQQLSSNMYVEDPSSPTGFTRTQSYEEQIKDENNPLTQASSAGHTLADKWSKEAQPRQGKGFVDLIMDGDITGALQKGVATAGESLPTTLSWATPYTAILNAIGMAGGNYREYTLEDESIPAWKRASMAIGSAAFEQAVEKYADPVFKYIGGTKILKGAAKEASKEIVEEVTKNATETLAKRIYKGLTNVGKDALGEGAEEVVTTFGNDALGEVLDYVEGSTDYGVRAQWEKLKKENPNANLWDFSKQKAKEYGDSFIGGYLSGAYTSGTAQVTTKALQYATGAASEIDIEGKRGTKIVPPVMDVAQAFDNGYSLEGQEMNDAMNMYDMQRNKAVQVLGEDKVAELDANPVDAMAGIDTEELLQVATDYVNAKATFDGMGQKVLDDINAQIAESEKNLNELTSKTDGKIHPVTLKGERKAHIVDGNVAVTDNGEIDAANSDLSILVRDDETGKIEFVSPSDIVTSDGAIDAEEEKANVAQTIRDAVTQQADAQMNGILSFNVGDEYDVLDDEGNAHTIAVVDNGQEGQVLVSVDGENVARMMPREEVQKMANNANLARLAAHEAKKETKRQMENGETSGEADNNNVGANEPLAATPDAMPMIKNSEDPDFLATTPERGHRYLYDEAGIPKAAADNMVTAHISAAEKEVKKQSDALAKLDANPGTSISAYKAKQADIKGKLDAAQAAYDYWNGVKTEQGKRDEAERQAAFAAQTADASGRQNELAAQKTPKEKIDAAKQMYGEYFDSDFTVPYDAMELVAMNMPNEKISWEGREGVRGLQQELGSNFKRGVGRDKGTNAFNIYLAKKGEGISTDEAIHSIYESAENTLPNGEHRWDIEEIRGAFIDMFMGAEKPSDIRDYVLNNRIRQAEQMRAAEDEAAEMARLDDEIMQRTGMEREEYAAWIAELEAMADAQAAYENEVYNETNTSNDRETEGSIGEEGSGQGQGQEGDTTGVEEDGAAGIAEGGRNEGTQGDTTERQEGDLAQTEKGDVKKSLQEKVLSWLSEDNVDWAEGKDLGEIEKRFGNKPEPIAIMPAIVRENIESLGDDYLYCGKAYMIDHHANHHPELDVDEYVNIQSILDEYDDIKDLSEGNKTKVAFVKKLDKGYAVVVELSKENDKIMLHKTFFYKDSAGKRTPFKNKPSIKEKWSVDGSTTISPIENQQPADTENISALDQSSASKGTENSETDKETEQKFNKGERFMLASGADSNDDVDANPNLNPNVDKVEKAKPQKSEKKVSKQRVGGSTLSKEADATEMMMRDALIETMEGAGIEVVTDVAIGQQVLDENANATREMRVYHGSGADFDAFDHSHMGEGEGAQAYGWGTYVTEVEGIGKTYALSVGQNPIGRRPVLYKGESYDAVNTDGWSDEKKGVYVDLVQGMRVMGKSAEQAKDDLRLMTEVNIRNRERSLANLKVSSETYQSIAEDKRKQEERLKHINEFNADDFTREGSTPTLYTVEIPEENAAYYIGYNERMREQQEIVEMADNELAAQGWRRQEIGEQMVFTNSEGKRIVFTPNQTGADFYEEFVVALGSKKAASEFLSSVGITGIKYPAEFRSGGRTDGASNYVIFDESDIEITNKARLFRTSNGEVYGYTMGGKIYLDTRIATTETPIHEYSHLWSEALEQANPKAWEQLKNDLVKDTELMDYVKGLYPEIEDENELMHEVFAHFSGKRGRARLEEMRKEETEKANGLLDKARIIAMFHRLKELLGRYWTMARDLFAGSVKGLKKMKAEDFADMAMADLLGGFNPGAAAKNATAKKDAAYMEAVKNGDMETAQKMVDEAAKKAMPNTKVVDESGNPLVVFHGTTEDFTVFDHTKARTNMDIQGMFFSPWELDAKGYGGNTRGFYLNITNPASFGVGLAALRKFQGQNGAGTKAREYLIEQGYDGVNNDNEEYIAFYPEQIKSADAVTYDDNGNVIPLSERFNKENNDIRYQFVGEQGATEADKAEGVITRIESLATAKQMEADGRPAINIKMATGWERGKDGKWRYETEDFDVSHDSWEKAWEMGDGEYVLLPELIGKDDILFKEYPDLANVKVYPNRRISEGGYYSHPNEIHVSAKNTDNVKIFRSTLLHEVQHAIQHREGFERGTNWEKYTLDASADELHIAYLIREEAEKLVDSGEYKRLGNAINHVASLWEENGWYNPRVDKDGFYYAIGLAHDYEADLLNEMSLPKAQYEAKEKYLRNAGEVEARNVQTRASMTAKERRRTLAEETEDYLRGEQIVTNGDAGGSASVVEDKDEVARLEAEQGAAEAVKMHYDALAQKYHGKPYRIVMSIDEMADEDFLKEMGKTEEDLSGLTSEEIRKNTKEQKEYAKTQKIGGGYNPVTRKIIIFAENIPSLKETEDTFFHENLHGILHELYGDNPQSIALRFWDAAEKWSDKKSIIAEAYRDESEHRQKEEFFVYLLSRAMVKGRVDEVLNVLTEEDAERVENILSILGYDRQTEELDRRREKGKVRENNVRGEDNFGQDVQADRHRRTVDVAQGGKLYRQPAFYSNAERAVERIKQEKATPEQWLAMIQKAGGLKAGEDKWMGLSDWLRQQGQPTTDNGQPKAKTLTKQEVLDFIRSNRVEVEDVNYAEESKGDETAEKEFFVFTNDTTAEAIVLSGKKGVSLSEASRELLDERYGEGWEDYVYIDSMGFVRKGEFVTAEEAAQFFGVEYDKAAERAINSTRIDYTTEGLENKREIALVVPSIEPWNESDEIHFGDAGGGRAVAWVRFGETTDADGKRVLVIDEVQSKRHQEGRENGYADSRVSKIEKRIEELQSLMASTGITQEQYEERDQLKKELDNIVVNSNPELKEVNEVLDEKQKRLDELKYEDANKGIDERVQLLQLRGRQDEVRNVEEYDLLESEINSLEESINNRKEEIKRLISDVGEYNYRYDFLYRDAKRKLAFGIPDAPFDKNWHELAMKRMLRYAAENGYDKIAWTKGAQQADRYNLSKVFNSIEREDNPNEEGKRFVFSGGNYEVMRIDDSNKVIYSSIGESEGKNLGELVGKDLAIKMMGMEDGDAIDSEEIRIGGEGMMAFYDQMLPRFMDKYGKKWGVKTTEVELPEVEEAGETMWAVDVTPEMRESVMEGQPMFREGGVLPTYEESLASSKAAGYTKKQHDAWWNRAHKNMRLRANEIAKKLHLEGIVDIYETADDLNGVEGITEEDKKSKGWYDPKTGRIAIILGNHASAYDVMMTMLHEGVAHFGLRQLFGKNFETFLWNVYSNATPEVRSEINKLMAKNGWNYETATEEYLAGLAEDIDFDRVMKSGWWWKIKDWFVKMLRDIGLGSYVPEGKISDNELRYVLWRSYYNLELGGAYGTLLGAAIDVAKQYELGVGKFAPKEEVLGVAESGIGMSLEETNRRFNDELRRFDEGQMKSHEVFHLGGTSPILSACGINTGEFRMTQSVLSSHMKKHGLTIDDLFNLPEALKTPIMVYDWGTRVRSHVIITNLSTKDGRKITVAIHVNDEGVASEITDIASVHGKDAVRLISEINNGQTDFGKDNLKWVDKEKALEWLSMASPMEASPTNQELSSAAKVVENFVNPKISAENVEKNAEKLHRSGDGTPRAMARDTYERLVMSGTQQFREAVQDSMLSLKNLYKSILKAEGNEKHIKDVAGYENAYLAENRMHSASQAQISAWTQDFFTPIVEEVYRLVGDSKSAYEELNDYLMAKHGLERNIVLAERDARKEYDRLVKAGQPADLNSLIKEYREKDYSGLTALTGENNTVDAELLAQQMVDDFEASHDTTKLWARINAATKSSLEKMFRSGLMSKARYEDIRDMFAYYIPLQGFDEKVAEDMYAYVGSDGTRMYGTPIRSARGRRSKADNPLATIAMNGEAAIRQGNRNEMKQHFLNFVQAHPSDVVSVSDVWLRYNDVTDEWEQYFDAGLKDDDSPEEVERKVRDFNERMEQLAASNPDRYKRGRDAEDIPFRVVSMNNASQHQVIVKRGGKTIVLTINGNPRAAQALNGLTNPDVFTEGVFGKAMNLGQNLNRLLSSLYTTRNPEFVASNYTRDALYSNCMTWVKESPAYAVRFHKNFGMANPAFMAKMFVEWENGELRKKVAQMGNTPKQGSVDYMRKQFYDFMMNGGETGWTSLRDIEAHKKDLEASLKKEGSTSRKAWKALGGTLDIANRAVENCARFSAFVTSREMGRSLERSIYDAKEVSVNFNKKGAGDKFLSAKGQTKLGKTGSAIGGLGRGLFVFFNAGVQGMANYMGAAKHNPAKLAVLSSLLFGLGSIIPIVTAIACGGDDDDEDSYYNLPEYVRRSNLCFRWRKDMPWIKIPLPIEFRAMYGLGELSCGVLTGKERYTDEELTKQYISQVSQVLPLDFMEGGGGWHAFVPSSVKPGVEAYTNKGWTGLPIYKDNKFKEHYPQWTRAYDSADKTIVEATRWLNEATGGSDVSQGMIDWNPARIEYMLKGYLGGYYTMFDRLKKSAETAFGKREFEWRNVPIASRFVQEGDERTEARKAKSEYFDLHDEYEKTKSDMAGFKKIAESGRDDAQEYAERLSDLENSQRYVHFQIMENYKPILDAYNGMIKEAEGDYKEELKAEEDALRRELIELIHAVDDEKEVNIEEQIKGDLDVLSQSEHKEIKKAVASVMAKQLGGKYRSSTTEYGKAYEKIRNLEDLTEDLQMQIAIGEAEDSDDVQRNKALEKARRDINTLKKRLGDPDEDDEKTMRDIRKKRRDALKRFGKKSKE